MGKPDTVDKGGLWGLLRGSTSIKIFKSNNFSVQRTIKGSTVCEFVCGRSVVWSGIDRFRLLKVTVRTYVFVSRSRRRPISKDDH